MSYQNNKMYCKTCKHFLEANFPAGYGVCTRLTAQVEQGEYENRLSTIQPPAIAFENSEIGVVPTIIRVKPDFGCIEHDGEEEANPELTALFAQFDAIKQKYQ